MVGSFLRRDHALFAARLRQAARGGAKISLLNATGDHSLIPSARRVVVAPSGWVAELAGIAAAVAEAKGVAVPAAFADAKASDEGRAAALSLVGGDKRVVLLGNTAVQHPDFALIHAAAQFIAETAGATLGFLTEAGQHGRRASRRRAAGRGRPECRAGVR